jgi:hypothetical protein
MCSYPYHRNETANPAATGNTERLHFTRRTTRYLPVRSHRQPNKFRLRWTQCGHRFPPLSVSPVVSVPDRSGAPVGRHHHDSTDHGR